MNSPGGSPIDIILTAGASCPDALLDEVLCKIVSWFPQTLSVDKVPLIYIGKMDMPATDKDLRGGKR